MNAPRFIDVFIDANPNTPEGCGLRWKAEGEPAPISRVRLEGQWCQVQGWSSDAGGSPCAAMAVKVEDSSAGTAMLIFGGDWGLRISDDWSDPSGQTTAWYGEPYLLLSLDSVETP